MISPETIQRLDSRNVVADSSLMTERFNEIWQNATNAKKNAAVRLAGYSDTRSFTNARSSGKMSVRMIAALSVAFNVDPFYLSALTDTRQEASTERIEQFIREKGLGHILDDRDPQHSSQELIDFVSEQIVSVEFGNYDLDQISADEFVILLQSLLIRDRATPCRSTAMRVALVKILLAND